MFRKSLLPVYFLIFLGISCARDTSPEIPESEILARVGDRIITARDFRLNYEFGFPHLMASENRREEYLHRMIAELLIAKKGYDLKVDTLSSIRNAVQTMWEERVIEEVFEHFVLSRIEISPEELQYEVNKSSVSIQYRFLPASNQRHALLLQQQLSEMPFEQVASQYITDVFEPDEDAASRFTSRVTRAVDMDPELLSILQDLEIHTPSPPVMYNGQLYIFIVHNIIRTPLSQWDIAQRSVSARKVIYNTKAMQQGAAFVNETMAHRGVETIRATFDKLTPQLYELYDDRIPVGYLWNTIERERAEQAYYQAIWEMRREPLVRVSGNTWTVQDFFGKFNTGRYQLRPDGFETFALRFADIIALVVRDDVFLDMARNENLHQRFEVQRDIQRWQDKWVFQETRSRMLDTLNFTNQSVMQFVTAEDSPYSPQLRNIPYSNLSDATLQRFRRDYLAHALLRASRELQETYGVTINYTMLDTITINESRANPNMSLQVFNQNSNRMAFPVLDPIW